MRSTGHGAEHADLDHLDWVEDAPRRTRSGADRRTSERRGSAGREPARYGAAPRTAAPANAALRPHRRVRPPATAAPRRTAPARRQDPPVAPTATPSLRRPTVRPGGGRAPRPDAGHVPAGGLRPRDGLQRLGGRGLLQPSPQLLLLRPPARVGVHRRRRHVALSRVDYAWFRKAAMPIAGSPWRGSCWCSSRASARSSTAPGAGSSSAARACSRASSPRWPRSSSSPRSSSADRGRSRPSRGS